MTYLVVMVILVQCMARIVSPNYLQLFTDKIVKFDATSALNSESSLDCALACELNHPCVSYAYHPGRAKCYLYDRIIHHAVETDVDEGIHTFTSEFGEQNIAFLKPTAQGSTYGSQVSGLGVDGRKNGRNFHTSYKAWWCVDLMAVYEIKWAVMYNHFDDPIVRSKIKEFEIWLAASGGCTQTGFSTSTLCYKDTSSTALNIYTINNCSQPNTQFDARYVFIYQPTNFLHLYEVEIVPWCC